MSDHRPSPNRADDLIDLLFTALAPGVDAALRAIGEPRLGRLLAAATPHLAQVLKRLFSKMDTADMDRPLPELSEMFSDAAADMERMVAERLAQLRAKQA